ALSFAQTKVPEKPNPNDYARWEDYNEALINWKIEKDKASKPVLPQCTTILKCKALIKTEADAKDILAAEFESIKDENPDLKKQLGEANRKHSDAIAVLDTLATQLKGQKLSDSQERTLKEIKPGRALDLGIDIEKTASMVYGYATKLQDDFKNKAAAYDSLV